MVIKETFLLKFVLRASVFQKQFLARGFFVDHKETSKLEDELTVSPRELSRESGWWSSCFGRRGRWLRFWFAPIEIINPILDHHIS